MRDGWGYRQLMGVPERILISSSYRAEPAYPQVHVVGPMLRDEVRAAKPRDGDYLLAYFNKGEHQYLPPIDRSEEHTSELQSLMRISYAVFCLNKKKY